MSEQFVISLKDLVNHKPTKVDVGETEMVLIREGERVHALQAKCPHAGAPLEQGAVCGDRLVCPWHKAEFDINNGKMCEPLALDNLKRYPVRIENGSVYVSPKAMSSAGMTRASEKQQVIAVLGGGAAGSAAIWTLRDEGFDGKIVLIERDQAAPYDRTALSKFVPSGKMDINDVPRPLKEDLLSQIERVQGTVIGLDIQQRQVKFADKPALHYDKLLIASGATPQKPDLPGKDLKGVHLLRSKAQAADLLNDVDESQQLVIIGNSFIGMEMAGALRNRDIDVTVVARSALPFAKQFGEEIGHYFRDLHSTNGVKFVEGEPQELEGEQHVTAIRLKDGKQIKADVVLLATGVKPATGFIGDLTFNKDGSIATDSQLQVDEHIWAAGDMASYLTSSGYQRIEHYRVAMQQGRIAAKNMLGLRELYDRVPFFWTAHYGSRYEYLGHASEWDSYKLVGSLQEKRFMVLYGQQGKLAAVFSCGMYTLTAELVVLMQQPMTMEQGIALAEAGQQ